MDILRPGTVSPFYTIRSLAQGIGNNRVLDQRSTMDHVDQQDPWYDGSRLFPGDTIRPDHK